MSFLIVGSMVCFLLHLCPNCCLVYIYFRSKSHPNGPTLGRDYRLEDCLGTAFNVVQIVLSIVGSVGALAAMSAEQARCNWLEAGMACSLYIAAGTNVSLSLLGLHR
jgi:hypothetical protein